MIENMNAHISTETKISPNSDKILMGYITLANHILELNNSVVNNLNEKFTCNFFEMFLFDLEYEKP